MGWGGGVPGRQVYTLPILLFTSLVPHVKVARAVMVTPAGSSAQFAFPTSGTRFHPQSSRSCLGPLGFSLFLCLNGGRKCQILSFSVFLWGSSCHWELPPTQPLQFKPQNGVWPRQRSDYAVGTVWDISVDRLKRKGCGLKFNLSLKCLFVVWLLNSPPT